MAILKIVVSSNYPMVAELFNAAVNAVKVNYGNHIEITVSAEGLNSMLDPDKKYFALGYYGVLKELNEGRVLTCKMIRRDRTIPKLFDFRIVTTNRADGEPQLILAEEITDDTIINIDKETRLILSMHANSFVEIFLEEVK